MALCKELGSLLVDRIIECNNNGVHFGSIGYKFSTIPNSKIWTAKYLARNYGIYIMIYKTRVYFDNKNASEFNLNLPPVEAKYHSGALVVKDRFITSESKKTQRFKLMKNNEKPIIQKKVVVVVPKQVPKQDLNFDDIFNINAFDLDSYIPELPELPVLNVPIVVAPPPCISVEEALELFSF